MFKAAVSQGTDWKAIFFFSALSLLVVTQETEVPTLLSPNIWTLRKGQTLSTSLANKMVARSSAQAESLWVESWFQVHWAPGLQRHCLPAD